MAASEQHGPRKALRSWRFTLAGTFLGILAALLTVLASPLLGFALLGVFVVAVLVL